MKVGIASNLTAEIDRDWPKVLWVAEAFRRNGHVVDLCRDRERYEELMQSCDFVIFPHKSIAGRWPNVREAFKKRTCPVVYWWFDLIAIEPRRSLTEQALYKQFSHHLHECDIVLVKERGLLADYQRDGVNAFWFDQGCLSDFPKAEFSGDPEWDVLLWGQAGAWKDRVDDVRHLIDCGFKVAWASKSGNLPDGVTRLEWTHPEELYKLAGNSRCVLSCGLRNDIEGYWSDSFWIAVSTGSCVIRRKTPGMPDGPYIPYHNKEQLEASVRWVLKNPSLVEVNRRQTREWATTEQSLERKAENLINLVQTVMGEDG